MAVELPLAIAAYFDADETGDAGRVAQCFATGAVVKDEGHVYAGREAIRDWKASSNTKFTYTCTPIEIEHEGERITVTGHLVGNFPGSPVDLRYIFRMQNDRIAELEIIP